MRLTNITLSFNLILWINDVKLAGILWVKQYITLGRRANCLIL